MNVILGVGGGIAAYKAADLLRRLTEAGHEVQVLPEPYSDIVGHAGAVVRARLTLARPLAPKAADRCQVLDLIVIINLNVEDVLDVEEDHRKIEPVDFEFA